MPASIYHKMKLLDATFLSSKKLYVGLVLYGKNNIVSTYFFESTFIESMLSTKSKHCEISDVLSVYFSFYITICNTYKTVYSHIKFLNLDFNQRRPQSIYQQDQSTQPLHHISTIPDYSNFFLLLYHSPAYKLIVIHWVILQQIQDNLSRHCYHCSYVLLHIY